jgi:hypothetical protein
MMRVLSVSMFFLFMTGCFAPGQRLAFPAGPISVDDGVRAYDVDGNGRIDYRIAPGESGRLDLLEYDDDEDGIADRVYRLSDYAPDSVPHLIVLFDSIPFAPAVARSQEQGWTWFDPPVKVIPPFPTMSPVIFSCLLGAPPQAGAINQYYDRAAGRRVNRIFERATGDSNPWERRLHYRLKYWQNGLAFLNPRPWFAAELALAKPAFDASPDRVTIVYFASTACMISTYGEQGLAECLDGLERLCMQVLYERRGAVKISVVADHGHTLCPGTRIDVPGMLRSAGFRPTDRLREDTDVVVEQDGLVNYAGVHTIRPAEVARALAARDEIELAMYLHGERVIVRSAKGAAAVERRGGLYRYLPIDYDVLDLDPVVQSLHAAGKADAEGWASHEDWFNATMDHRWPDAPSRVWGAFHGIVVNTPDVMMVTRRGYYTGLPSMDRFVDMASTHGGLDQDDSATVLLTMTGRGPAGKRAVRTEQVMMMIEPSYDPSRLRR